MTTRIISTSYMGSYTNTSGGLRLMHFEQFQSFYGARNGVRRISIVITDGESNLDQNRVISDAEAARAAGIDILVLGITNAVNIAEVSGMSSMPQIQHENWWLATDFGTLSEVLEHIVAATCDIITSSDALVPSSEVINGGYCFYTEEEGTICLCIRDTCNIEPLNGTQCTNVNECQTENGGCHYQCIDTQGSFYCTCPGGFNLAFDQKGCEDVNECNNFPCGGNQCVNTYGGYYCLSNGVVASGGSFAALTADAAVLGASNTAGLVSTSTVVVATALAAVGTVLVAIIVALGVRRFRTARRTSEAHEQARTITTPKIYGEGPSNFGFAVDGKFMAGSRDDALSEVSTSSLS